MTQTNKIDANKVPRPLVHLVPMAEKWGIGDDYDRERAVDTASPVELEKLAHCMDNIGDEELTAWLTGPESHSKKPSRELMAYTNLLMAIHSAKAVLQQALKEE